jgi:hypothetical protein
LFAQEINVKEETFGISSSSTSRKDHEARHKSRHAMNMTPNDPRTEASTCKSSGTQPENSEACIAKIQALTMKETTSKAHMQVHTNKGSHEKQPRRKPGPKWAWAGRPGPIGPAHSGPNSRPPFALGSCLFIASASAGRHIHPSIGTRRNLGEGDDGRRESSKSSRRWPRPTLATMADLHG